MSMNTTILERALERAVQPGPERLLAGVAVAAATSQPEAGNARLADYFTACGTVQLDPASPPVTTKTTMWIASCTKLVTTIAAMQCVERGLFSLDNAAHVDRLVPEWQHPSILTGFDDDGAPLLQPARRKITLRHLLTHTSGIAYDVFVPNLMQWRQIRGQGSLTMQAPIPERYAIPLVGEPGSVWQYGGGLDVAGLMVARANNCTLEQYMRTNIFDVLGMNDTSFLISHNGIGDSLMPIVTRATPDAPLTEGIADDAPFRPTLDPKDHFGGLGLFSNVEDFLKLLKAVLLNDGSLLKPATVDEMFKPCISKESQASLDAVLAFPPVAAMMIPGEAPVGTPGANSWSFGLGGIIALKDEERRRKKGYMRWGGAPNLQWWIDREGGTCGVWATQLFPMGEDKHMSLTRDFVDAVLEKYAAK
ncbi:hypothetical protein NX059_012096 [Plenodomus lindquistii]|nr:hypothetical protein NX059_012096 [Plenodomus lindquistii]